MMRPRRTFAVRNITMKRHKPLPQVNGLQITGLAEKGRGVARDAEGRVYFIQDAVPGDVVDVQVVRKKKSYREGVITKLHTASSHRVTPFCPHFEHCGGCGFQHVDYDFQVTEKERMVEDMFRRMGHLSRGVVFEPLKCEQDRHYRNKLEFAFSAKKWLTREEILSGISNQTVVLGFHPRGAFDKVLDMEVCYLQGDPSESIRRACLEIAREQGLTFYDVKAHTGLMRQLVIRVFTTGQVMVIVGFGEEAPMESERFLQTLIERIPSITSLYCFVNTKWNDFFLDLPLTLYHGIEKVQEDLGHVRYAIGPKSFFQTNTKQAVRLYDEVLSFAQLTGRERVYDLYTGLGSIALYIARLCQEVIGIEEVPSAIEDARVNAALNGITNTHFYAGDVKALLNEEITSKHGSPDLIITDPPRAGMHQDVVEAMMRLAPSRIVYVSCNPATQVRDIQWMNDMYAVVKSRSVDMFPHTHHLEHVVLLEKR